VIPTSVVRRLVELAVHAPSVHNTQPWIWRASGNRILLYADDSRRLSVEDPVGRNLVISCGTALDHFRYAANALGWHTEVTRFDGYPEEPLAQVELTRGRPSRTAAADLELVRNRCTDRRRFTSWPVPTSSLLTLVDAARSRDARAEAVVEEARRIRLELLAHRAHLLRMAEPGAITEQQGWVGHGRDDGVPPSVLPARAEGSPASRFGPGLVRETRTVVESGDGLIVLGGRGDDPVSWLRTGEALSALWLDATRAGLSVVPLSLPVEIASVRDQLRDVVLDDGSDPHLLVRIGWQAIGRSQLPRTPRRQVDEVLRTA
jgi:nitroreductase